MRLDSSLIHLFVYGTLKPGERSFHLCARDMVAACTAIAQGQLYHLPLGYPAMTLAGEGIVQGVLLSFAEAQILERLDAYEQHDPVQVQRCNSAIVVADVEYQRNWIALADPQGIPLGHAWTYTMTPQQICSLGGQYLPQGIWLGQTHGLP